MWRKLTLLAVFLGILALLVLPLQAKPPQPPPPPPPGGPGLIAFACTADTSSAQGAGVFLMNPDGTQATQVADWTYTSTMRPNWSRPFSDGTVKLGWVGRDPVTSQRYLAVVNVFPEVGTPTQVIGLQTNNPNGPWGSFDWSLPQVREEDGKEIVRVSYSDHYTHPDGGSRQDMVVLQLIYDPHSGTFTVDPESEPVVFDPAMVGSDHYGGYAHFSNDGTWLAFEATHSYPDGSRSNTICVARSDEPQSAFELIGAPGGFSADPAWSPDGTQLAFVSDPTGASLAYPNTDVYIASLDLANRRVTSTRRLTTSGTARCVTWSPDGKQVSYGWYTPLNKKQSGYYVRGYYAIGTIVLATGQYFELVSPSKLNGLPPSVPDWSPTDLPKLPW